MTRTPTAHAAQHAPLTPDERRGALSAIAQRRDALLRELRELNEIEAGHRAALAGAGEGTGRAVH